MSRIAATSPDALHRCQWAGEEPAMIAYHDQEWGVPLRDERRLFEFLVLEGAQAGLSWRTVLLRRDGYRRAFSDFDPERVARFGDADVDRLLADPGIVRNRAKVTSAIANARAVLDLQQAGGSLTELLWSFVGGEPVQNRRRRLGDIPAVTAESKAMSRELKRRGFSFVGPTICYALMQATGMVNDHVVACFRHRPLAAAGGS
jgi:DNA-3-methyladenine glycosylase I